MREDWQLVASVVGVGGAMLMVLVLFLGIQQIRGASTFNDTARATVLGTVQESHEVTNPCSVYSYAKSYCPPDPYCQASVSFTPLGQHTSFTLPTTADNCETLPKGTPVKILYDPRNPSTAETPDQASDNITGAIWETIGWLFLTAIAVLGVFAGVMVKLERAGPKSRAITFHLLHRPLRKD